MNILDYLEHEFSSFDNKPFSPVDSAVLSQFCMVRCEGLVPALQVIQDHRQAPLLARITRSIRAKATVNTPKDAIRDGVQEYTGPYAHFADLLRAERYPEMFAGLVPERIKDALGALAASPRFRTLKLTDYLSIFEDRNDNQFAAVTFVYKDRFAYIGFRGTDTSIVGWRENFNMAYAFPVPAQSQALRYLNAVAPHLPKRLYVGGHSKGGNLALYAALKADTAIQDRIDTVFIHDAPGFKQGAIADEEWERMEGRIHRTIPQESIVGMLMDCPISAHIIQTKEHGFDQHSVFNWNVDLASSDFIHADKLADSARFFDDVFSEWLALYSEEDALKIVDAIFKAIEISGISNASELFFGGVKTVSLLAKAAQKVDDESGAILRGALGSFASIAANHAGANVGRNVQDVGKNIQSFFSSKFAKDQTD